jgi:uncharacterized protein (UPF0335 family)
MSNVETTITHVSAQAPPPAGDNSEKFGVSPTNDSANVQPNDSANATTNKVNAQLRSVVDRIERIEEEKSALVGDIKDIYNEAKGNGYDVKALRTIIRLRKIDANDRAEQDAILDTYMIAMGMI